MIARYLISIKTWVCEACCWLAVRTPILSDFFFLSIGQVLLEVLNANPQFNEKHWEAEGVNVKGRVGSCHMSSCTCSPTGPKALPFAGWLMVQTQKYSSTGCSVNQISLKEKLHHWWVLAVKSQWFISSPTNPVRNYLALKMYQRRILSWMSLPHTLASSSNLFVIITCLFSISNM